MGRENEWPGSAGMICFLFLFYSALQLCRPSDYSVISTDHFGKILRLCLDQRIFVGKAEEKTEERKMRGTFGTKENSNSFPPEYCTILKLSHEKKHLSRPLVFSSCVEVQGSYAL